jgi:biotin carboxyl carrier protein
MKFEVQIAGRKRVVEITPASNAAGPRQNHSLALDGKPIQSGVVEVSPGIYSILLDGQSFEVRVEESDGRLRVHVAGREFLVEVRDPRQWRRRRSGILEAEGRQQVIASMPGKIVRLLVKTGEAVEAKQGLLVVEAMKMQNEICAPKRGTVERLLVNEGQAVNAGEVLAIIT